PPSTGRPRVTAVPGGAKTVKPPKPAEGKDPEAEATALMRETTADRPDVEAYLTRADQRVRRQSAHPADKGGEVEKADGSKGGCEEEAGRQKGGVRRAPAPHGGGLRRTPRQEERAAQGLVAPRGKEQGRRGPGGGRRRPPPGGAGVPPPPQRRPGRGPPRLHR